MICSFLVLILFSSNSILISASDLHSGDPYNYKEGSPKGPENWGDLPESKACRVGKFQSPIDIQDKILQELPQLGKLKTDYKSAAAVLKNRGHDVMVEWNDVPGKLDINGSYYELVQCHWHTPSEHTLNGTKFDVELHAVHQNSNGDRAVIGVFYKIGKPDPFLSKILKHIKSIGDKNIDVGKINPKDLKFGTKKYYRYMGSLTSPPCTEGVIWTIVKKVRTISEEQLQILKEAVHPGFEMNARPIQELNGRQVCSYTHKENKKI